jgi:hypothetical protein
MKERLAPTYFIVAIIGTLLEFLKRPLRMGTHKIVALSEIKHVDPLANEYLPVG